MEAIKTILYANQNKAIDLWVSNNEAKLKGIARTNDGESDGCKFWIERQGNRVELEEHELFALASFVVYLSGKPEQK